MTRFNDCFAGAEDRMTVTEALARFSAALGPVTAVESVGLRAALGRVLARDLAAPLDVPRHDNAAVDGYAVYFEDLTPGEKSRLPVGGRIAAGHPLGRPARPGEALQIFTGGPIPEGPDTVFMVEDCTVDGATVVLPAGIKRGDNFRHRGEDVGQGDVVMKRGLRLRAQEIGMAATLGAETLAVYGRLRVAVFSTGDEIREPGGDLGDGCVFDANRYSVMAMLDGLGAEVSDLGILPDTAEAIEGALAAASREQDLLITSGGVSMGEEDHVRAAVEALGALHFWNLAIKPGRPIALGNIGAGEAAIPFIGLPGNPVAAMVTFMRIARPIVLLLSGAGDIEPAIFRVPAGFGFNKKTGRREWLRVRLVREAGGRMVAKKYPGDGSGILSSMVEADGLVELAEDQGPLDEGDLVDFLPFSEVAR